MIEVGDSLPDARFSVIGDGGPEFVQLADFLADGDVVLFGLPGAFTRTCSALHLPGFIRAAPAFRDRGVAHVLCISVNDPFVMQAWDRATGAGEAGVRLLADGDSGFTRAIGMAFSAPELGFIDRCRRFSMLARDGRVALFNPEPDGGVCDLSSAETLLAQM